MLVLYECQFVLSESFIHVSYHFGCLDNTKHLIFWLCNTKQLNFRHFNTNSKRFTRTVNIFLKETKTALKGKYYFVLRIYQGVYSPFPTISDHVIRFPKTAEDSEYYRRFLKISEEKSENFRPYSAVIYI